MAERDVSHQNVDEFTRPLSSPVNSVFSRGHASKSSASSLSFTSSPNPRESFDLYPSKLDKVAEEQEKEGQPHENDLIIAEPENFNDYTPYRPSEDGSPPVFDTDAYTLGESGESSPVLPDQSQFKRQKSSDNAGHSLHKRLSSRFGSMSRRLKNRSGAGPQLSIVTHMSAPASRAGSVHSAQVLSPAVSAISKHESYLPSPTTESVGDSIHSAFPDVDEEMHEDGADGVQAATPLLPPVFAELSRIDEPVQSPLQSPSIAPTPALMSSRTSLDIQAIGSLPSPPLSTKPSMISIRQRSRANTATAPIAEIPPLQLVDEDPWSNALGHANFSIHPEPYLPSIFDLDSYADFRSNWDQARTNYAKHVVRTIEHYGSTSKVFRLTEEKWSSIDKLWKDYHDAMTKSLGPQLKRASEHATSDSSQTSLPLEKPVSRVVMPEIDDKSGKFPELGDGEIVGPMDVAPPPSAATSPTFGPMSDKKRNLLRFLQDMFSKP